MPSDARSAVTELRSPSGSAAGAAAGAAGRQASGEATVYVRGGEMLLRTNSLPLDMFEGNRAS